MDLLLTIIQPDGFLFQFNNRLWTGNAWKTQQMYYLSILSCYTASVKTITLPDQ